jgi:hypothetical protein
MFPYSSEAAARDDGKRKSWVCIVFLFFPSKTDIDVEGRSSGLPADVSARVFVAVSVSWLRRFSFQL